MTGPSSKKKVSQKELAKALHVSPAYLSALEHGKKGNPSWAMVQDIIQYFDIIWDDAEELEGLSRISHPKITIDTAGLNPKATELANRLSKNIDKLEESVLDEILKRLIF
ncbi:MAG: helix-turn-helix domain-containing protein [Sphingomonadales bacterium]